ncbi:ornithine cyclodeaminase family protein, partial [Candidatus Micrarchaeota archaeon CG06_land_8_20_14_3_00_50_6]
KQELESSILNRAKVVVDNREQAVHSGEINVPISSGLFKENQIVAELVQVVRGENKVRYSPDDLTLFVSTGLAIQDLAVASMVYEAAKAKRIGVTTEFV